MVVLRNVLRLRFFYQEGNIFTFLVKVLLSFNCKGVNTLESKYENSLRIIKEQKEKIQSLKKQLENKQNHYKLNLYEKILISAIPVFTASTFAVIAYIFNNFIEILEKSTDTFYVKLVFFISVCLFYFFYNYISSKIFNKII